MKLDFIIYEKKDRIAFITLNRPDSLNAIHPPALEELQDVWDDFRDDPDVWVAILTGSGEKSFCVGADLKYRTELSDERELRRSDVHPRYTPLNCYKPIIAAVNGYAIGGGLELVLGCDIIVASSRASFGLPEARRGLLADAGGVIKLPRRIPYHQAMAMVMTGKMFTAEQAQRMGLVNEVVEPSLLSETAHRWATEILECSPLALKAAKQVILNSLGMPQFEAENMIESYSCVRELRESADYSDGPRAFTEKRKPVWTGK